MAQPERPTGQVTPSGLHVPEKHLTIISGKGTDALVKRLRDMPEEEYAKWQEQRARYNTQELLAEVRGGFRKASKQVIGREEVLAQTFFAFLTREHQLLYSRAGTAKTLLSEVVFDQFSHADTYRIQMTKGTPEEALVGAVKIEELKEGKVVHNTAGSIVDARLAFLDEVFDANDVALRSLLGILNERWFRKGEQEEQAMLHTAIAATNYVRSTDVTEAVVDRFAYRAYIEPDTDPYTMLRIDGSYDRNGKSKNGNGKTHAPDSKIPFDYVEYLADVVEGQVPGQEISSPPHVLFLKNELILEYMKIINEQRGADKPQLYISPRTIAKTRDILNASALLHDRKETRIEDLDNLKYMICTIGHPKDDEDQEAAFEKAKDKLRGITKRDLEIVDTLMNTNAVIEEILEGKELNKPLDLGLLQRVKLHFGWDSLKDITFGRLIALIERTKPESARVIALQKGMVRRLEEEERRYTAAGKYDPSIF